MGTLNAISKGIIEIYDSGSNKLVAKIDHKFAFTDGFLLTTEDTIC